MAGSNRHNGEIIAMIKEKNSVQPIDYIFTIGTPATQFAHDSFDDIPIFFSMINSPLQQSFGNKISGIALDVSLSEQVRLLRTILPNINRLGVVYDPKNSEKLVVQMKAAAKELNRKGFVINELLQIWYELVPPPSPRRTHPQ